MRDLTPDNGRLSMVKLPNVCLELSNKPESVVLVRQILTGVAEAVDLGGSRVGGSDLNDIRTAVTEACNNVVLHAYEGGEGPMEVELFLRKGALEVIVRDRGVGIGANADALMGRSATDDVDAWRAEGDSHADSAEEDSATIGIGLSAIRALAHRAWIAEASGGGTELRMEFATSQTSGLHNATTGPVRLAHGADAANLAATQERARETNPGSQLRAEEQLADTTLLTIAPTWLAHAVLPRALSVLAADAHFSVDRISDTQLVADAIAAHAGSPDAAGADRLSMAVRMTPRNLELRIGPLEEGAAERLMTDSDAMGVGLALGRLADRRDISMDGVGEMLTLGLVDRR
jgi:serine/threonine-protein kinase RsbW